MMYSSQAFCEMLRNLKSTNVKGQGRYLSCLRWRQKAQRNHIGLLYQGAQDRICCVLCDAVGFERESGVCEV